MRLAGGHAAAYDDNCLVVESIRREDRVIGNLESRYQEMASLLTEAAAAAGVSLELGALPGEYCPGRFSLHLPGGPKVGGIAQRIIRGAGLTTAVLAVRGGEQLRATIADVYAALDLPVRPETAGAIADCHPNVATETIARSVIHLTHERFHVTAATASK